MTSQILHNPKWFDFNHLIVHSSLNSVHPTIHFAWRTVDRIERVVHTRAFSITNCMWKGCTMQCCIVCSVTFIKSLGHPSCYTVKTNILHYTKKQYFPFNAPNIIYFLIPIVRTHHMTTNDGHIILFWAMIVVESK